MYGRCRASRARRGHAGSPCTTPLPHMAPPRAPMACDRSAARPPRRPRMRQQERHRPMSWVPPLQAQNAIRKKNEQLNYMKLSSRLDAVVSRLETQAKMAMVTKSMSNIVGMMAK